MEALLRDWTRMVESAPRELMEVEESLTEIRPGAGQWSAKEILGHLADSAHHNHRRFVEAQWKDDLVFAGYDQERWVETQEYQKASWAGLVALWRWYNLHLVHVVAWIPKDAMVRARQEHSLDRISMVKVSADKAASLEYLVRDYVHHLRHHLREIFALLGREVQSEWTPSGEGGPR